MRIRIAILAAIAAAAAAQNMSFTRIIGESDLTGKTYLKVTASGARVEACRIMCNEDTACAAFTVSVVSSESSLCELKSSVGSTLKNRPGFTSGIKVLATPDGDEKSMPPVLSIPSDDAQQAAVTRPAIVPKQSSGTRPSGTRVGGLFPDPRTRPPEDGVQSQGSVARPVPTSAALPQLAGKWSFPTGDGVETVNISQSGDVLTFVDRAQRKTQARFENGKVVVDAWKMDGTILNSGKQIRWTNGSLWSRGGS